jgi:hypothetical protein
MNRKLTLVLAGLLATGLIAAGCGGDDDDDDASSDTGTTATALTKEEWISQADAICKASNDRIEATGPDGPQNQQQVEAFVTDTLVPEVQSQLDAIKALGPPEGAEDEATKIVDEAQSALDEIKADPSAITQGKDPFAQANADAQAFGMKECGQG